MKKIKVTLELILKFYDIWRTEPSMGKAAIAMGFTTTTLEKMIQRSQGLTLARDIADQLRGKNTLSDYVLGRMSPESRRIWKKLRGETTKKVAYKSYEFLDEVFKHKVVKVRQEVFCHALIKSSFDASMACRIVGINRTTLTSWSKDVDFCMMLEECQFHKKNFFESQLIGLVEERHPAAVMFVNRTINRDRGYGESLNVQHDVTQNGGFTLDDLELDIDTRRKVLHAIREKKKRDEQSQNKQNQDQAGNLRRIPEKIAEVKNERRPYRGPSIQSETRSKSDMTSTGNNINDRNDDDDPPDINDDRSDDTGKAETDRFERAWKEKVHA